MQIADLHIHSKYSRATSQDCVPESLDFWARRKGITLLGTGDFTHPAWRAELAEKLVPAEDGLYRLKEEFRRKEPLPPGAPEPRFVLTGEISSIYKKNGRTRKVHSLILLPSLEAAETLSRRLEAIGNIHSDGRPILGLDCRDLLEITLEACPEAVYIPAHIWTPHFSVFGAFSGFDSLEECYEDLTPCIHALETGLSSDPAMNWQVSALDGYQLVSNSDAHSPQKLGREANLLDIPLSYRDLSDALSGKNPSGLWGTIEFFPEEGKYHWDGHRNCHLRLSPAEAAPYGGRCPICGKKLTIGVQHRVEELGDRPEGFRPEKGKSYESLVPLEEAIAWSTGTSPGSVRVKAQYEELLAKLGTEFFILREAPISDISKVAGEVIGEGIRRLRLGKAEKIPGYDGEYGVIRLMSQAEIDALSGQVSLFGAGIPAPRQAKKKALPAPKAVLPEQEKPAAPAPLSLNPEQQAAVDSASPVTAVIAGPGTGKTRTLVSRIAHLIRDGLAKPSEITAVTFTNKAAGEMRERLEQELGGKAAVRGMTVGTFHAICLGELSKKGSILLASEETALEIAGQVLQKLGGKGSARELLSEISLIRNGCAVKSPRFPEEAAALYQQLLKERGITDFDGLLEDGLTFFRSQKPGKGFTHLLCDEFQDINPIQYELLKAWAKESRSLFVIGDPDQSIYGFRGSDARCFDRLAEEFPGLLTIRLKENYRSSPEIVSAALSAIAPTPRQPRILRANRPQGGRLRLISAPTDTAEAIFAAKEISRLAGGMDMTQSRAEEETPRSFSEIAILCRTRRQMELLETCLRHDDIPCVISGEKEFLQDPTARGLLGFLGFLLNPADTPALCAALKGPFSCPPDLIQSLEAKISALSPKNREELAPLWEEYREVPSLHRFLERMEEYLPKAPKEKPLKLLESLAEALGVSDQKPVQRLIQTAAFHPTAASLLKACLLGREGDFSRMSGKAYAAGAVTLSTLHAAKGLEFPVVFLYGLTAGCIPLDSPEHPADMEEERRLFYVGITRAKERLYLLTAGDPSPFLSDLPESLLEKTVLEDRRPAAEASQLTLF